MSRKDALRNIIYYALYLLVLSPVVTLLTYKITGSEQTAFMAVTICSIIVLILMLYGSKKYFKKCFSNFKASYLIYPIAGYIVYYFAVSIGMWLLTIIYGNTIPISENQESIQTLMANYNYGVLFVAIVIVAPIMEELVFRTSIIYSVQGNNKARKKYLIYISYLLSIVIFSLMHMVPELAGRMSLREVIVIAFPYIALSIALLYNFTKTKYNVLTSILCHMLNNFIAYIVLIYFLN